MAEAYPISYNPEDIQRQELDLLDIQEGHAIILEGAGITYVARKVVVRDSPMLLDELANQGRHDGTDPFLSPEPLFADAQDHLTRVTVALRKSKDDQDRDVGEVYVVRFWAVSVTQDWHEASDQPNLTYKDATVGGAYADGITVREDNGFSEDNFWQVRALIDELKEVRSSGALSNLKDDLATINDPTKSPKRLQY